MISKNILLVVALSATSLAAMDKQEKQSTNTNVEQKTGPKYSAMPFKKINEEDLEKTGNFYPITWDNVIRLPYIEMANGKILTIAEYLQQSRDCKNVYGESSDYQKKNSLSDMLKNNKLDQTENKKK